MNYINSLGNYISNQINNITTQITTTATTATTAIVNVALAALNNIQAAIITVRPSNQITSGSELQSRTLLINNELSLNESLRFASRNGHLNDVKYLLDKLKPIDGDELSLTEYEEIIGLAVFDASSEGHLNVIECLFNGRIIAEEYLGISVLNASENGHLEIVQFLFDKGTISEDNLGKAVHESAKNGHLKIVQFLFDKGTISEDNLGKAVHKAAKNGHLEIVKFLFDKGTISEYDLGKAVHESAKNGHLEIVKFLFDKGTISEYDFVKAVHESAKNGHLEIVKFLFDKGTVSEYDLGEALVNAAKNDHLEIISLLLNKGTISEYDLGKAVHEVAKNGHLEMVQFLFDKGTISEADRGKAVNEAAKNGHLEIVEFLFDKGTISEYYLGKAVHEAAKNGHLEIVQFLFDKGTISEGDLGKAVNGAAKNCHLAVIKYLLGNGRVISKEDLGDALVNAAKNDHLAIIKFLLGNIRIIPEAYIKSAIKLASKGNNPVINEALRHYHTRYYAVVEVSLRELTENPVKFLKFFSFNGLPFKFKIAGSISVDAGGLTKQVISTLFERLQEKYQNEYWPSDKFLINRSEGSSNNFYTDLAKVLSLVFKKNEPRKDKILIGNLFNVNFFSILKSYMKEDLDQNERLKEIVTLMKECDCDNDYYKSLFEYIISSDDTNKADLLEKAGFLEKDTENFDEFLKKEVISILQPLEEFTAGLSTELKEQIKSSSNPDELLFSLQGSEVTSEKLKNALKFNNVPAEFQTYIIDKINNAEDDWLKQFVKCITGNKSLSSSTSINIQGSSQFAAHTCVSTLDIPLNLDLDKDAFLSSLDFLIEGDEAFSII